MVGVKKVLSVVTEGGKAARHELCDLPPKKGHRLLSLRLGKYSVLTEIIVFDVSAFNAERRFVFFVFDRVRKLFHTVDDAVANPFPHLRKRAQPRIRV